jgi:hypothetical protein
LKFVLASLTNCQRGDESLKKFYRRVIGAEIEFTPMSLETVMKRRTLPDGKAMKWQTDECRLLIHHDIEIHHVEVFDALGAAAHEVE